MSSLRLPPRAENIRVFFAGVRVADTCCAQGRRAARWHEAGAEWVRPLVGPEAWEVEWPEGEMPLQRWAIDFPPGADDRSLVHAGELGRTFQRAGGRIVRSGPAAELRIALAKCDRYLATPAGRLRARWRWVSATALPCRGLLVAARDDEFLAGVLSSSWAEIWLRGTEQRLGAKALRCFPLPWSPDTPRGTLTREQEERRGAVVQAWRAAGGGTIDVELGSDTAQDLDAAVAIAYGWPAAIEPEAALRRLKARACPDPDSPS